ncbi:HAMP domain-containing sensor histidine kinase [Saccharibacillus sp. CPCC 101409]|uniref:sensor histidine kinase n=1 Tax=Saccharibacillus sp. CPCC 101409 TaxID=3058041 RepID=UPI0026739D7E|nr:HAMP domain-containing sensor histidine kinase [Saccharibacillus sp. CPCC 101409]MDO3412869.1 HAMP domain-containing sensor histidine kinase [Saccharibacillus sp. CPCC 101409]
MIKKGIGRQIVMHYFIVVFLALMLVEVVFLFAMRAYYYDTIYNMLSSYINVTVRSAQIVSTGNSEREYLNNMMDRLKRPDAELQILDGKGKVLISSSGFKSDKPVQTSDIPQALASGSIAKWIGRQATTGEPVMAVTTTLQQGGGQIYLARFVTSIEKVNQRLTAITLFSMAVIAVVLVIVLIVGIGLANSIVRPINNIIAVSAQMAKGRFDVRVEGDYRYELGEMGSTLNYMAEEIVRSNQIKDDFISSISHELRTPLTSIKGWSETLDSGGYDPEETKLGMGIISKETQRLIGLVEELLDFSKLQQNEMKLTMERVELKDLLKEIILNVWAKAELKQVQLRIEAENDSFAVYGDANRLKQVFLNIVDNAVKFSHENSLIVLHLAREDGWVRASVRDSGIGIDEENLKRVKDRFFQVNTQGGGTGLGLAITQQLVELHEGEIEMASELGVGTTVTVKLPLLDEELPQLQEAEAEEDGSPENAGPDAGESSENEKKQ